MNFSSDTSDGTPKQMNESLQIVKALQMQMEVQRKLHEQIEVQRHLQLRIKAQGKYLQSVLKKAQETLAGYSSFSVGVELAKAELSQLVSMVNTGYTSSSFSKLIEVGGSSLKEIERKPIRAKELHFIRDKYLGALFMISLAPLTVRQSPTDTTPHGVEPWGDENQVLES
ncbi:hypothetical protein REPUB_Repub19eG0135100 [Reevesia pubescens]